MGRQSRVAAGYGGGRPGLFLPDFLPHSFCDSFFDIFSVCCPFFLQFLCLPSLLTGLLSMIFSLPSPPPLPLPPPLLPSLPRHYISICSPSPTATARRLPAVVTSPHRRVPSSLMVSARTRAFSSVLYGLWTAQRQLQGMPGTAGHSNRL